MEKTMKNHLKLGRFLLLVSALLLYVGIAGTYAQKTSDAGFKVLGVVRDKTTNETLPGVSILVEGTSLGTVSNFNGEYSIKCPDKNSSLIFSFIGYANQSVKVASQAVINVKLDVDATSLEEVVVVSFGKQKKNSVVSAITAIKPAELRVPSSNLTTALAGNVAGITSFQRGGEPGKNTAEFYIRGISTFGTTNNPLILIDGIELTISDLEKIHPDDIASFSIMKDASATALYGARGANGVIYITTKEGKEGPARISARVETSFSSPTRDVDITDPVTYMKMHNEAVRTRNPLAVLPYSLDKIYHTELGDNPVKYPTTDWQKELFKDYAVRKSINLSASGGGKVARYYISIGASQEGGILKVPEISDFNNNVDYRQYIIRSNTNIKISENTKLKVSFTADLTGYNGPRQGGSEIYNMVLKSNPVMFRPYYEKDADHEYTNHILFGNAKGLDGSGALMLNPYAKLVSGYQDKSSSNIVTRVQLNQDLESLTKGLDLRIVANGTKSSNYTVSRSYNPYYYKPMENVLTGDISLSPLNEKEGTEYLDFNESAKVIKTRYYLESALNYNRTFKDIHNVGGILVFTMNERFESGAKNLEQSLAYRNMGVAGRFTYGYNEKYFAEFNFGYNGSERFAKNERWGFFPSVALGWMMSNEPFMKGAENVIDRLKIRGSYGIVGNDNVGGDNDRFFYLSQVNLNNANRGYTTGENYGYNKSGVSFNRYSNDQITWEQAYKLNIGFELELLNALKFEVDYFTERRTNILTDRRLPKSFGLEAAVRANVGEAKSSGLDGSLTVNKSFGNSLWIQGRVNVTYSTNEVSKKEEPDYSATPWLSHIGQPINQQWGLVAERLFVDEAEVKNSPLQTFGEYSAGDIKYKDINNDGIISGLDRVPIGNPTVPELIYGFGTSIGYKGFDVSVFFQGSGNSSFWINVPKVSPFSNGQQVLQVWADDYWSEDNRNSYAKWPRLSPTVIANNAQKSTYFMADGAFLRFKSMELGYNFSKKMLQKLNLDKLRIYVSGYNLHVWSTFDLWDPEMAGNGMGYPNQKTFNFGARVTF